MDQNNQTNQQIPQTPETPPIQQPPPLQQSNSQPIFAQPQQPPLHETLTIPPPPVSSGMNFNKILMILIIFVLVGGLFALGAYFFDLNQLTTTNNHK